MNIMNIGYNALCKNVAPDWSARYKTPGNAGIF